MSKEGRRPNPDGGWRMKFGMFLLRMIVGGIFAVHGYPKLFGGAEKTVSPQAKRYIGAGFVQAMEGGPEATKSLLQDIGIPEPELMVSVVGGVEFFGGIMLMLGWLTRLVSLALIVDMVVAIKKVHWKDGLTGPGGYEFPLALAAACLAVFLGRPGRTKKGCQ
jgi:putative oxidoreductase